MKRSGAVTWRWSAAASFWRMTPRRMSGRISRWRTSKRYSSSCSRRAGSSYEPAPTPPGPPAHRPTGRLGRLADAQEGAPPAPSRPAHLRDDDGDPRHPAPALRFRDPDRGPPPPDRGPRRIGDAGKPSADRPDGEHGELRPDR